VRLPPDGNTVRQDARRGREHVHFIIVASGHPELASVGVTLSISGLPPPGIATLNGRVLDGAGGCGRQNEGANGQPAHCHSPYCDARDPI
jgi:hypothetical protein